MPQYNAHEIDYEWLKSQFLSIFKQRSSSFSPLKQHSDQSLRDYISALSVKAFKLMGHKEPEKREEYLILALQKRLFDRSVLTILKQNSPKSLEEAYNLI